MQGVNFFMSHSTFVENKKEKYNLTFKTALFKLTKKKASNLEFNYIPMLVYRGAWFANPMPYILLFLLTSSGKSS